MTIRVTTEEVREAAKTLRLPSYIKLRSCSLCSSPLYYIIDESMNLSFDSNCDCVTQYSPPTRREWHEIAALINMQTDDAYRVELAVLFGLSLSIPTTRVDHDPREDSCKYPS